MDADLCEVCGKKIKLFSFIVCKCRKKLCQRHFQPEAHDCQFDYKSQGKEELQQKNPLIEPQKIEKL
tara:strand:+ start:123 stop:323 length:201 start_codon:yes stop_codon:yes gene_type:complete